MAVNDVRKEINFCLKTNTNILGIVENFKELFCEFCGKENELFGGLKTD